MDRRSFLSLLCFVLLANLHLIASLICYDTGNFTANDTYSRNRGLILASLAANVTAKPGFFYNSTVGQGTDEVYASALCRPDSEAETCLSCVNERVKELITECPNQKEAYSWGGEVPCLVRYSNRSFFGRTELDPFTVAYNVGEVTSNLTRFDEIWGSLLNRLARTASTGSPSASKYAAEKANFTLFQTIHALVLCTPDLSQSGCEFCLRESFRSYNQCCHGKIGGPVQRPSCFFRWDMYAFYGAFNEPPPPPSPLLRSPPFTPSDLNNHTMTRDKGGISSQTIILISIFAPFFLIASLAALLYTFRWWRKDEGVVQEEAESTDSLKFNLSAVRAATGNFSPQNELGHGGFGAVYKGKLPDGQDIAVKRLSRGSGQGEQEFRNEVLSLARLEHKNLVRLLGFCLEGNERLLIYEFVPKSSLDHYIFDPIKRLLLSWDMRYKIIGGIARGLLYLHEDSRLKIIHRDLKASNILLDAEMNPKISDFGMAKLCGVDESQLNTRRIVGTFGYMAPEYARDGRLSSKADVYSFGVLLLEIVSGKQNNRFCEEEATESLVTYAWRWWKEARALKLIDPILRDGSRVEMTRCIHIGLLCVQENVARRPTMAQVVLMLSSSTLSLPVPSTPGFFVQSTRDRGILTSGQSRNRSDQFSLNQASFTELGPR